jgi:hypothetical protein
MGKKNNVPSVNNHTKIKRSKSMANANIIFVRYALDNI